MFSRTSDCLPFADKPTCFIALWRMLPIMFRTGEQFEVVELIIRPVPVSMVDDVTLGY
jgi:hypothetical protein